MERALTMAISTALRASVVSSDSVAAGHGAAASHVRLADGRELFVKAGARERVDAEARDLEWLHASHTVRTPRVLAVLEDPPACVLE